MRGIGLFACVCGVYVLGLLSELATNTAASEPPIEISGTRLRCPVTHDISGAGGKIIRRVWVLECDGSVIYRGKRITDPVLAADMACALDSDRCKEVHR